MFESAPIWEKVKQKPKSVGLELKNKLNETQIAESCEKIAYKTKETGSFPAHGYMLLTLTGYSSTYIASGVSTKQMSESAPIWEKFPLYLDSQPSLWKKTILRIRILYLEGQIIANEKELARR